MWGSVQEFYKGYKGEITEEGRIIGEVPQWIYSITREVWYEVVGVSFEGLTTLKIPPTIPNSVTNMENSFKNCSSLEVAPNIPDGVTNMFQTFWYCTNLREAPVLPSSVTGLSFTFYGCASLKTAPVIPNSVTGLSYTFSYCTSLETVPVLPDGVTDLSNTFYGCTSLETAPTIPANVECMYGVFEDCKNLKGEVKVLSNKIGDESWQYRDCFAGAATAEGANLVVKATTQATLKKLQNGVGTSEHITFELLSE